MTNGWPEVFADVTSAVKTTEAHFSHNKYTNVEHRTDVADVHRDVYV